MTEPCQRAHRLGFRAFMVRHQYKVLFASIVMGLIWVSVYRFLSASWFFSRLSLLLAIISFVPAGLVVLAHGRELGPFVWWDRSNVVLTARRPRKLGRLELTVMAVLWGAIFVAIIVVIFWRWPATKLRHHCDLKAWITPQQEWLSINPDYTQNPPIGPGRCPILGALPTRPQGRARTITPKCPLLIGLSAVLNRWSGFTMESDGDQDWS